VIQPVSASEMDLRAVAVTARLLLPVVLVCTACGPACTGGLWSVEGASRGEDGLDGVRFHDSHGDPLPWPATGRYGTWRFRHAGTVTAVAYNPSGTRLATTSSDGTARVWSAATGQEKLCISTGQPGSASLTFRGDGRGLVTSCSDGVARLWDATTGKCLRSFRGPTGLLFAVSDSQVNRVATVHGGGVIWVWRGGSPKMEHILAGDDAEVGCAAFDQTGTVLAAGCDETLRLWAADSGALLRELRGHSDSIRSVSFCHDSARLVTTSNDMTARVWDAGTGRLLLVLKGHKGAVNSAAFSPDGRDVASAGSDGTVRIWDAATGRQRTVLGAATDIVGSVAFRPDGRTLVASVGNTVQFFSLLKGKAIAAPRGHLRGIVDAAIIADGRSLMTASRDGTVAFWAIPHGGVRHLLIAHPGGATGVDVAPNGSRAVSTGHEGSVRIWNLRTMRSSPPAAGGHRARATAVSLSPNGKLALTSGEDGTGRIWDAVSGEILHVLPHAEKRKIPKGRVNSATFSPDGSWAVTAGDDGVARVWASDTGRLARACVGHGYRVTHAAFAPAGNYLLTASGDNPLRFWDSATGELVGKAAVPSFVWSIAIHPAGDVVAAGLHSGQVSLSQATAGQPIRSLKVGSARIVSLSFSPEGRRLATGDAHGVATVWDWTTGVPLLRFAGHRGTVNEVLWLGDGRSVITVSEDTSALQWAVYPRPRRSAQRWAKTAVADLPALPGVLEKLWSDLASNDWSTRQQTAERLVTLGDAALPFLERKLSPPARPSGVWLKRALAALGSESYVARVAATEALRRRIHAEVMTSATRRPVLVAVLRTAERQDTESEARERAKMLLAEAADLKARAGPSKRQHVVGRFVLEWLSVLGSCKHHSAARGQ